jgi:hypothetical protein
MTDETPAATPLPTRLAAGDPQVQRIRVLDAETGETIPCVLAVDTDRGTISRFETRDGNLVREDDRFRIVDEERAVRLEWIDA